MIIALARTPSKEQGQHANTFGPLLLLTAGFYFGSNFLWALLSLKLRFLFFGPALHKLKLM